MKKVMMLFLALFGIFTVSKGQSGITWTMGLNIANNSHGNLHPRIALDGGGNPLVVWGRMSDESVFFSRWTGAAFTPPVKLNPSWLTVATASWMGPDIASKGDTVYVVLKRTPEASDTNYIYIMTSFNGGITFSTPVRVDFIADSISRFPTVAIDPTGNPIVAFMKFNSTFGDARWVVSKSIDYGNTFLTDVKASGWSGSSAEVCDCCPGAMVSSGNFSAVLYRDNLSNIRDVWAGVSNNNSASFNSGFSVDNNNWMIMSCPASGPDGVIVGDSLYTVFMSGGSGGYRTYLSKSSISSGVLNSVTGFTGSITGLGTQNYPRIASDGIAMAMVWRQTIGAGVQLPILFSNNISTGFPLAYDTVDLNDITNADVALSNGNVFVVWQDDNSGTVKFRSGVYNQVTNTISSVTSPNNYFAFPNPSSDYWFVDHTGAGKTEDIIITNSMGMEMPNRCLFDQRQIKILTSDLPSGLYFLRIKNASEFHTIKLMKK